MKLVSENVLMLPKGLFYTSFKNVVLHGNEGQILHLLYTNQRRQRETASTSLSFSICNPWSLYNIPQIKVIDTV